ncbi:MAG: Ig-like domain repeat protein [Verrucomicrobia bacterium]|nr:Ig-like domain repeat protein [Verrucomicrobiota bacterium]
MNSIPGGTWATSTLTYTSPASGPEKGQLLRIELSSAGIQSVFDNVRLTIPAVPPAVLTYTPPDGGTTAATSDLVLTFSKPIAIGTGDITIKNLTDSTPTVITLPDSQVSISGAVLTINPTDDLLLGKDYAVQISAGAVKDLTNLPFAGILDDTTWNFSTADPTATIVTLVSSGPSIYGDSVTFTATVAPAPSGGTVQFFNGFAYLGTPVAVNTTTGEASVTTSMLGVVGPNEITAEYSGNFQFAGSTTATSTSQVVDKAPLTVTAQNVIRFVDTPNPAFTYQITGFKNGQTLGTSGVTGTPDLSTTAVTESPVGDYPITTTIGSLAADNYSFTTVDATLSVVAATPAGTLGSPQLITNNATSGISSTNTYTHAVNMGGGAVTINGVLFSAGGETGTGYSTTNFMGATSGNFSEFPNPADAVATMLDPFRFGNVGQTLTITGLTPGQTYDARIYYREWVGPNNRSTLITFDEDGASPHSTSVTVNQDATPEAFYLSYVFTATTEPLLVSFAGTAGNPGNSFHLSGFSVQTVGTPGPPTVASYTPPVGGTTAATSDLVLTFNEPITIGTGDITIKNLTDNSQTVITLPDSQVSISGAVLTINPTDDLLLGKDYAVQISAGAVKDLTNEPFAGILDDATWYFSSADPTATTVTVVSSGSPSIYGDSVTFTATVDPVPSGGTVQFKNGVDALGSPVPVDGSGVATVTTTTLGATTHQITADYSGNYQYAGSTSAPFSQVVDKAPLTVTAQNVIRYPDTANPDPLPYQITGFKNGQTLGTSGVTGTPALSTTAVPESPVGEYPITCAVGTLAADNYSFTTVDATLSVVAAYPAGTLSLPQLITSDATSGISSTNTYTHAVNMGGDAVSINGVPFAAGPENGTGYSTTNFEGGMVWWGPVFVFPNPGDAVATMLESFRFGNPAPQTLTITGLTPGQVYDARIYYRQWVNDDNRSILITFDEDGASPHSTSVTVNQDATPGAFYLSYTFTATNAPLLVSFAPTTGNTGASFHLSGFSVQTPITSGFGAWAATNAGGQTPDQDYDNDGVENGIEYFMGETGSSFTAMPGLDATNTVTWKMDPAYSGTYEVQTSTDLVNWMNVDPRPTPSGGILSYTLPTGAPGGKSFVRLLVTPTP